MKYPKAGDLQRATAIQITSNPAQKEKIAALQGRYGAAIERVRGLLVDPDPASMDVALDVALEAGLSLADLGEMLAKEGPTHLASPESTGGWADEGRSAGEFILSNVRDEDDPRFMSVAWWVQRGYERTGPNVSLFVNYHGQQWDESDNGVWGASRWARGPEVRALRDLEPIIEPTSPSAKHKAVRSKAAALAWRIARELKEHSLVGSDAVRVAMALRHMTAPMPPRVAFNPMLGNPPTTQITSNPAQKNPYEVRSPSGLEGVFVNEGDAEFHANELRRAGVHGVKVERATSGPRAGLKRKSR